MVELIMSGEDFEQDIRPLIKSFYPEEELVIFKESLNNCLEQRTERKPEFFIRMELWPDHFLLSISGENLESMNESEAFDTKSSVTDGKQIPSHREYRNHLHRAMYRLLNRATGKKLPWGTLTGIRPVKQVLDRLEAGESVEGIRRFMKDEYYCSDEKLELSIKVAAREKELLDEIDYKNGYSIYIGIPFCPTTCSYCSFTSYSTKQFSRYMEPYLSALSKEIRYAAECFPHKKLNTIYIGGGTPTTLLAVQLEQLIHLLKSCFDFEQVREFTVEAGRPDSITKEKLIVLKQQRVDRISINPQTMRQHTLNLIGRRHEASRVEEAFYLARELGFDNINMDMIIGLSGEAPEDVEFTLDKIAKMSPDSLTVHTLAIKRAARINTQKDKYEGLTATGVAKMMQLTKEFTGRYDYLPYYLYRQKNMAENLENIGYSKKGKEGIYNVLIMEEKQTVLALGAGASSKFVFHKDNRIERVENVKSLTDYITRIDEMIDRKQKFITLHSMNL